MIDLMPRPDVLVVEDNRDGRESLEMVLNFAGFSVETACDGEEGVAKGACLHPRAAVVDIGLPLLDGFGVARELRRVLLDDVLLIAHTAWCGAEARELAKAAGFDHFLCKPCDLDKLIGLLRAG